MQLMGFAFARSAAQDTKVTGPSKYLPVAGVTVDHPNHVWCSDILHPVQEGFLYLVAIMDWHSRKVLTWRVSKMTVTLAGATNEP